jgi:hypothetical protein
MWIRLPNQKASNSARPCLSLVKYCVHNLLALAICAFSGACLFAQIPAFQGQTSSPTLQAPRDKAQPSTTNDPAELAAAVPAINTPREFALQIIHRALLETVWGEPTVSDVRQSIQMFDKKRSSFGKYVRAGRGTGKLRMSLQVPAGDHVNSLLQISDGEMLTTFESIGTHAILTQVDLGKVRERLTITSEVLEDPVVAMYLAIGGQAELLRKLCQKYDFNKVTEGKLHEQKVWWIRGTSVEQPLQKHARASVDVRLFETNLSAVMPKNVKLAIGLNESSFPFWLYQIETWDDSDDGGRSRAYVLTEWDSPMRLTPQQHSPELFRLSTDPWMHEIRDETKLYLPPPQTNLANQHSNLK